MKKFHLFFLCAFLLNLVSCNFELEDIPRQKQLVDITLDTDDALIDYPQNAKELNKRGIKIFGHYSDGSTQKENIEDAKFSGFDSTERGTITIDVEFKGIHKNFDINIGNDDPDYLEILNYPIKLLYWEEEYNKNIDLNGLEVVVHFLSGEFKKVDNKVFTIEKSTRLDKNRTIKICYNNDVFATFDVYVFNDKDFKDSVSTSSPLINYIKLVDSGSLNTINYRIGESIKLDGVNIDVKDLHNMKLCTIPCTQCYITEKKVIQNKENATVCINGKNHNIKIHIIDIAITGASLNIKNEEFIKNNHIGQTINFTNDEIFNFSRIYDGTNNDTIVFDNNGSIISNSGYFEVLKYSTSPQEGYDNAHNINENLELTEKNIKLGENTIYFYYNFYSEKLAQRTTYSFTKTIYVQDAKLENVTINAYLKNTTDNTIQPSDYNEKSILGKLSLTIKAKYTNYPNDKIYYNSSNKVTVFITIPEIKDSEYKVVPDNQNQEFVQKTISGYAIFPNELDDTYFLKKDFSMQVNVIRNKQGGVIRKIKKEKNMRGL